MKIEANSQIKTYAPSEQTAQSAAVYQSGQTGIIDTSGVSFQKNPDDTFIAQLEKEQGIDTANMGAGARSKTEILESLATEKDLAAFQEYSDELEDEELDVIVTVVEKIKTQLAIYCEDYDSGMVDSLSSKQLEKLSSITGNAAHVAHKLAQKNLPVTEQNVMDVLSAMELVENTGILSEDAIKNCLKGGMELTIENLYQAQHSGVSGGSAGYYAEGNGYYARAAVEEVSQSILPQIEKMLQQNGMVVNDTTMEQAKWLVSNQIPLTKENLQKYQQLQAYVQEISQETADVQELMLERVIEGIASGRRPFDALVMGESSVMERSEHAVRVLTEATEEQVFELTSSGREVTIDALAQLQNRGDAVVSYAAVSMEMDITFVTARRQLEEVRMQMTIQASAVMIRNGIEIETAGMQQLIDGLRAMEDSYYKELLSGNGMEPDLEHVSMYREITKAAAKIATSPAELIGTVTFSRTALSIEQIQEEGALLEEKYRQAGEAYEQVMTRPRSDMGDSIQKAFRNVDEILTDMGLELNNANRRAVRILGYNSMEITQDNLAKVKAADLEVHTMLEGMKPSAVLDMIRDGYNPLDKTITQVNEKLAQLRREGSAQEESYSEFLWNLEHSDEISEEERGAYVGIYRLLHQIEKTDGAVIGAVAQQGVQMTMRNLMTGIRSRKHAAMDYKIGETAGVEGTKNGSITEQIEDSFHYLAQLAGQSEGSLSKADLSSMPAVEELLEMSVEQFADAVQAAEKERVDTYSREQLRLLQEACQSEEQILTHLTSQEQSVTIGNLLAAGQLFYNRGELFRKLSAPSEQNKGEEQMFDKAAEQVRQSFTDEETASKAYKAMLGEAEQVTAQGMEDLDITYEQMSTWKLLNHQIRLCDSLSDKNEYHIPLQIGGELTSMHVQLVREEGGDSRVSLTWETADGGKVAARFSAREDALEGYVVAQSSETCEKLAAADEKLRQMIEQESGMRVMRVDYAQHEQLELLEFLDVKQSQQPGGQVSSSALYCTAKAIMGFVAANY